MSPSASPPRRVPAVHLRTPPASPSRRSRPSAPLNNVFGFPLATAEHTPQNVAFYAFIIGLAGGAAVSFRWTDSANLASCAFVLILSVGCGLEYITRALLRQEEGLKSFFFGGPTARENLLLLVSPAEYVLRSWLLPSFAPKLAVVSSVGVIIAIAAQNVRTFSLVGLNSGPKDRTALRISRAALHIWRCALHLTLLNPICLAMQIMSPKASGPRLSLPEAGYGPFGLPIFDGAHTPQNIAAHAYLLGVTAGAGLAAGLCSTAFRGLGFFIGMLAVFHVLEYICTAMHRPDVKMSAFLLRNGKEYYLAMTAGAIEFLVWHSLWPAINVFRWWNWIALVVVIAAQCLRSAAMLTAGANFTHLVADEKEPAHTLVTNGIYSTFRHPAYTAFYYWAIGTQLVAGNPICTVAFAVALIRFFGDRIEYEEMRLLEFFGDQYAEYRKTTGVWIPSL
ncbi:hypothetical protein HDU88_003042 [Geranomyces variabilis]|nr:hypothetical protein HDU88_003042 [Geranomyces variabilis]